MRTNSSQRSSLVRADNRDSTQCFHRLEGFAQNPILAHEIGCDRQIGRESDRQPFWDECDRNAHAVDNQSRNIDPVRMLFPKPTSPVKSEH